MVLILKYTYLIIIEKNYILYNLIIMNLFFNIYLYINFVH